MDLIDEPGQILTFEDFVKRVLYIEQSIDLDYYRPFDHLRPLDSADGGYIPPDEKTRYLIELQQRGRNIQPVLLFDKVALEWVTAFEASMIVAMRQYAKEYNSVFLNGRCESPNATGTAFDEHPIKQLWFGCYLMFQALRAYIKIANEML